MGSGTFLQHWGIGWAVTFVGCDVGQQRDHVEAHVQSLSPVNEMLVSEAHIDGSVTQNDANASILCRSQQGGSRVSRQVTAALIVSSPQKSLMFVVGAVYSTFSWLQVTLNYSGMFEKLPVPFIAPSDAQKTISMCFASFLHPSPPASLFLALEKGSSGFLLFCRRSRAEQ